MITVNVGKKQIKGEDGYFYVLRFKDTDEWQYYKTKLEEVVRTEIKEEYRKNFEKAFSVMKSAVHMPENCETDNEVCVLLFDKQIPDFIQYMLLLCACKE